MQSPFYAGSIHLTSSRLHGVEEHTDSLLSIYFPSEEHSNSSLYAGPSFDSIDRAGTHLRSGTPTCNALRHANTTTRRDLAGQSVCQRRYRSSGNIPGAI